jgi:hypothetical protein
VGDGIYGTVVDSGNKSVSVPEAQYIIGIRAQRRRFLTTTLGWAYCFKKSSRLAIWYRLMYSGNKSMSGYFVTSYFENGFAHIFEGPGDDGNVHVPSAQGMINAKSMR